MPHKMTFISCLMEWLWSPFLHLKLNRYHVCQQVPCLLSLWGIWKCVGPWLFISNVLFLGAKDRDSKFPCILESINISKNSTETRTGISPYSALDASQMPVWTLQISYLYTLTCPVKFPVKSDTVHLVYLLWCVKILREAWVVTEMSWRGHCLRKAWMSEWWCWKLLRGKDTIGCLSNSEPWAF